MHHNGKILYDCQSVKIDYETRTPALRYLYKNSSEDFVSSSDLCPFFLPHCRMLQAHTCLYSPSPSWALNCHADWWLGKSWDTLGCIRMQNITVTAGVRGICMRVCVRVELLLFWQPPRHKEGALWCCLCWVVSLSMFTVALCFFVSVPLLLPRLARLCLARFSLWCNTSLLQHQLFLTFLLSISLSLWPGCLPTSVATLLGFYPLLFPSPPHSVFFLK